MSTQLDRIEHSSGVAAGLLPRVDQCRDDIDDHETRIRCLEKDSTGSAWQRRWIERALYALIAAGFVALAAGYGVGSDHGDPETGTTHAQPR